MKPPIDWEKGRPGEVWVRWLYQSRGWYVMTTADYSGKDDNKAPSLLSDRQKLVVPDLLVFRKGQAAWVEVKDYAKPTPTYVTKTEDHGVTMRLIHDYQQVENISGIPCILAICEASGGVVLMRRLADLMKKRGRWPRLNRYGKKQMYYWPRSFFMQTSAYDRDEAKRMAGLA